MKLVLAEKPSVAQSIAKVLGAAKREDGYLEGNGYVVSWCVGHLVELAQPEVYDAKYSKWAYADLPIFPMDWQYEVSAGTKKQFGILKKLMAREDVASLVCATDAGREGELIFRLVYHKAGCRKPFERLWISSMEDVAIKEGFENLRSGTEYDALYEAALCRERADWIVGINATRLFSTLYGQTLNVGRVMTPTLAMAVMREAAISAFKPELFYTVQIGLDGFTAASERFKTKAAAEAVKQSCSVAIVQKAECKEKTEKPPALYDLTSLQREANRVLGYTAQQTLDYTQNLYEKKLVTYPRTDSRFLTEDMAHSLTDLVKLAFHTFPVEDVDNIPVHAEQVVNNKKVTDHHAIIPTRELQKCNLSELPKGELAILQLISNPEQVMIYAQRPNATFCKPYEDWNAENYRRYVKRGSTGIALFVMNRDKPYLRYVFDVADTGVRRSSPELKPWEVTPENRSYVMEAMERTFGVTYAGTIEAYKLTSAMATTEEYAQQNKYSHSLFVAGLCRNA